MRTICAGLALLAAAVGLAFSPAADKVAQAVIGKPSGAPGKADLIVPARVPPPADGVAPVQAAVPSVAAEPEVSTRQRTAAERALSTSAALKSLAGAVRYRVVDVVPWTKPETAEVVGADLSIEFSSPVSGVAALPGARFDDAGKNYRSHTYRVRVTGVRTASALVDLRTGGKVVDIVPGDEGTTEELPGNTRFQPRAGGKGL